MATSRRRNALGRATAARDPLDLRAARVSALDSLARRDHSSEELGRRLVDKGFDAAVVAEVTERLRAEKLLDDRRYVENFVSLHAARGHGPVRVRADLRKAGLQGPLVDEAVAAYPDWILQLRKAHEKKFGTGLPTHYADRQRQARFLGYRGFTGAQIRLALGFDTDIEIDT